MELELERLLSPIPKPTDLGPSSVVLVSKASPLSDVGSGFLLMLTVRGGDLKPGPSLLLLVTWKL